MRDAAADLATVGAGFAAPVADAQLVFRLALEAMAHPGRVVTLPAPVAASDAADLPPAVAALALTLCDGDTAVWLDHRFAGAAPFLRFHCGAPLTADPGACRFALAGDPAALPALDAFDLGSADYPDRSTTLIVEVAALDAGGGLSLRGPGIDGRTPLALSGLDAGFWAARAALAPLFPIGLDLFVTCGRRFAALPRTTIVET